MSQWQECKLAQLCKITRGASPRPIHEWISSIGTPWVKISDATESPSRYISQTKECIKDSGEKHSVLVFPGDLILSNSATPGLPRFMKIRACIHDGWLLFRDIKDIEKNFLYYLLVNDREKYVQFGNGSIFTNLKTDILKEHQFLLPHLPEQRAIADVLSSLDDKIDLLHRQNKTLEALAETLWRKMFVEEANPKWKKGKMEDEMLITMGQSPPGDTYNENKHGMVFFQGRAEFDFRFPQTRLYCTEPKRFAKKGDTLVSVRAPVGDINVAFEDCCIGRGLAAVRHKNGYTSYTLYKMHSLKDDFDSFEQQGTVFGSIGKDEFNNIDTVLPLKEDIEHFEQIANPVDNKIFSNSVQIRSLTQVRDSLLPKLMSGEVRVKA